MSEIQENVTNNNIIHKCPICLDIMDYFTPRYSKMICGKCANGNNDNNCKILDSFGNEVSFGNLDIYGGFASYHKINNEIVKKEDHLCFINNIKCYANEARFGGIVIQTMN
jgi:hypothetical protein